VRHHGNPHTLGETFGRETELETVRGFVRGAPREAALLTIEGPAGIGKTTVFRAGVAEATARGRRVAIARPVEVGGGMGFAGLEALLADLIDDVVHELPAPQRVALEVALLRSQPGPVPIERRAVATGTLTVLRALAARAPLLIAIDDLQWFDGASLDALAFALSRLRDEDVLVLGVVRGRLGLLELGIARERAGRLELGPLGSDALRRVVHDRFGLILAKPELGRLEQISGGNPFYALELVRAAGGRAVAGGESLTGDDLRQLIGTRLSALSPATQDALGVLSALHHTRAELIEEMIDADALDAAFVAGVLRQEGSEPVFAHPLLAAGAYAALAPARRRSVHRRLAALVTDPQDRARHLASATTRPDPNVAVALDAGAAAAASRGAPSAAADLLEAAARLTPPHDSDGAARRRLEAARQLFAAGDRRRATELCDALVNELSPGDLRAEALTAAWQGVVSVDDATAMLERAVEDSVSRESRARCLLLLSEVVQARDLDRARRHANDAVTLLDADGDPRLRAWAMGTLGGFLTRVNPNGNGLDILRAACELEQQHGSAAPTLYLTPTINLALCLLLRDELDEARELLTARYAYASTTGQVASSSLIAYHLSELECRAGNLTRARTYAKEALALGDDGQETQTLGALLYGRAMVAALEGETELARALAHRGLEIGRAVGDRTFPLLNAAVLGLLSLSLGDNATALEHLEPLPELFQARGYTEPSAATFQPDYIEALIAAGRHDDAQAAIAEWEALGQRFDRPRPLATGARCRGMLAGARHDLPTALAALEEALKHHERLPVPHELARTLLALGTTLRRAGRRRDAREALNDAETLFTSIGQPLWGGRARAEAARLGGRTPAGHELTPTEQRVAELVADGHSNREVANALFVTVSTVESNLTRIYRKLNLRSRAELAARGPTTTTD